MKYIIFLSFALNITFAYAQKTENAPKLVVGIVVDQMKNEYLHRFQDRYSKDGFLRLMHDGFYAANHQYSYHPTVTAPGHASIYTGTTPSVHGIIGNDWYNPNTKENMYCVGDKSVKSVGVNAAAAQRSPLNLKTTTITDELKLFWNFRSKVIGLSLKDRGAILPGGHLADGAYWYLNGKFVSSSFYLDELPAWVQDFNQNGLIQQYIETGWNTLYPISSYKASLPDDNPYEIVLAEEDRPVLPRDLKRLAPFNANEEIITRTHFGNDLLLELALKAIENEELGTDEFTDFLAISFSSTDMVGHEYGTRAVEIEDMYLRLDLNIARLLNTLDAQVGSGNYIVFLTTDHGGAEVAQFSEDNNLPGGLIDISGMKKAVGETLEAIHPEGYGLIEKIAGNDIYFDREKVAAAGLRIADLTDAVVDRLSSFPGIYSAYATRDVVRSGSLEFPLQNLSRGIHPLYAGDVVFVMNSGWMHYGKVGTTHGLPWKYDTHAPFLLYGKGVKKGITYRETNIRDIAPTLSMILQIPFPSGTTGQPIVEAIE